MIKTVPRLIPLLLAAALIPGLALGQIRINEVGTNGVPFSGVNKWVELKNLGATAVDVSGLVLCNFPAYPTVGQGTVLAGNTTIPAGGLLVVSFSAAGATDGEVGLYVAGTSEFGNAANVIDYMQYGSAGHQRESPAVGAGVWDAGTFIAAPASGESMAFVGGGADSAANWRLGAESAGSENTGATAIEGALVPDQLVLGGIYPNPASTSARIEFDLPSASLVRVEVYDLLGRRHLDTGIRAYSAGAGQTLELDLTGLSAGLYVYAVSSEQNGHVVRTARRLTVAG